MTDYPVTNQSSSSVTCIKKTKRPLPALQRFLYEEDEARSFLIWRSELGDNSASSSSNWLSVEIAKIDQLINRQLNAILHHPGFQKLEASWRGLQSLVQASGQSSGSKIRMLDISWKEITRDIDRAPDITQTRLFQLIYSEEFDMAGGEPYGVLLGDYQVAHKSSPSHPYDDIFTLQGLSQIAAAAFAPFICNGSPELFGLDDFAGLGQPIHYDELFRQKEYQRWNALRQKSDSRFMAVVLPTIMMRHPYDDHQSKGINFKEQVSQCGAKDYLWGNACYAFGTVLLREFGETGWFSHIRGVPRDHSSGGLVTGFTPQSYTTDSLNTAHKILTPVLVTDAVERQLFDLGIMSLCHCYDTPFAAFHSCPSLYSPKSFNNSFNKKTATANERVSAMLQQVLSASRFAHYIKVMIRDKTGRFTTAAEVERHLQNWLNSYSSGSHDMTWEMLARYPLREARVEVKEMPGSAGIYHSVIYLKPHYSADYLVSELKLTTELTTIKSTG